MRGWSNRWAAAAALVVAGCSFDGSGLDFAAPDAGAPSPPGEPRAGDPGAELPTAPPPDGIAFCPDGASFDPAAGFCVDGDDAYGPFTHAMETDCQLYGGGAACDDSVEVKVADRLIALPRWSLEMATALRGDGACMAGARRDPGMGGYCVERWLGDEGPVTHAFGPFAAELVDRCQHRGGGDLCFTHRWPGHMLRQVLPP
jgi:hypothetical protein